MTPTAEERPAVTLFTQAGCADSDRVRALLATGFFWTPLTLVGERPAVGCQPAALEAALGADAAR